MSPQNEDTDREDPVQLPRELDPDLPEEDEHAPLLSREERVEENTEANGSTTPSAVSSLLQSINGSSTSSKKTLRRRWPSFVALSLLSVVLVVILVMGFVAPQVAKEYASQAAQFEPTRVSIDSYTDTGVVARIEGQFKMNASRVHKKAVRDLGRFGTRIARYVELGQTAVDVALPAYGDTVLGTATIPSTTVCIINGRENHIDMLVNLEPGSQEGLRQLANDVVEGRFTDYTVKAIANVPIRSGILRLGKQSISQTISFDSDQVPTMPQYQIKKINFHELGMSSAYKGISADVSVKVENQFPLDFQVPPLGFAVGVDNCLPSQPHIKLADANTHALHVHPQQDILVNVTGIVRQLPEAFLNACPGSIESPFDTLLGEYIRGRAATVYVSGSDSPSDDTPQWISDLAYGVTVPVSFPGRSFGNLIKNFSMSDVHFSLPDFFAEPDSSEAQPKISATVNALINLPDEMNFHVDIHRIRSTADVFYRKKKLGNLDISRWHEANSTEVKNSTDGHPDLLVTSHIEKAPLKITDNSVFNEVVRALLTGTSTVELSVKALVDVQLETPLGALAVRQIPAKGQVPVKPIGGSSFASFAPKFSDLRIVDSSTTSLTLNAAVNFTNPTKYTADVPYANVNILINNTIVGHGTVKNLSLKQGNNTNMPVQAVWEPSVHNGTFGKSIGSNFLSQYISGDNTTLTLKPHRGTIPSQPQLGKALESLEIELPTPRLGTHPPPSDGEGDGDDEPHFIKEATMHLFTSTANFILASPLTHTVLHLTHINATAFYQGDAVGKILYDGDLEVPPGESETPKLPVDWDLGSVGYEAIKNALGGTLKLKAFANVGVRIGKYTDRIWFRGRSIGAKVRL